MSVIDALYAEYQDTNPEKFNEDFILLRNQDSIKDFIEYNCKALEIIEGIKFIGCEVITDESKFPKPKKQLSLEDSRFVLVKVNFKITAKENKNDPEEKTEDVSFDLFFPKLIDDFFYRINGANYAAIYQLVDSGTYSTAKTFTLKTIFMPIIFRTDMYKSYEDTEGNVYEDNLFVLDAFKYRTNVLSYFFAKMGFQEALDFLLLDREDYSLDSNETPPSEDFITFKVSKDIYFHYSKQLLAEPDSYEAKYFKRLLVSILNLLTVRISLDKFYEQDFWIKNLGKTFTKNSNVLVEKAESVLLSLERVLDECTINNLPEVEYYDDTKDIYAVIRWLLTSFDDHRDSDNMELNNKRLRLSEYLIYPVIYKFTTNIYRLINSKNITLKRLRNTFSNFSSMFAIKKLTTSELLRYSNCVNGLDLYAAGLKFTRRGPQSMNDGGGSNTPTKYRGLHPSYVGRIDLVAASSSDPGMTGSFTPFCKMDENNPFYFKKD